MADRYLVSRLSHGYRPDRHKQKRRYFACLSSPFPNADVCFTMQTFYKCGFHCSSGASLLPRGWLGFPAFSGCRNYLSCALEGIMLATAGRNLLSCFELGDRPTGPTGPDRPDRTDRHKQISWVFCVFGFPVSKCRRFNHVDVVLGAICRLTYFCSPQKSAR